MQSIALDDRVQGKPKLILRFPRLRGFYNLDQPVHHDVFGAGKITAIPGAPSPSPSATKRGTLISKRSSRAPRPRRVGKPAMSMATTDAWRKDAGCGSLRAFALAGASGRPSWISTASRALQHST